MNSEAERKIRMSRIDLIEKLNGLENRKINFENLYNDVQSPYMEQTSFFGQVKTRDFNKQYNEELIFVDKKLFKEYLTKEIENLEIEIQELIKKLTPQN